MAKQLQLRRGTTVQNDAFTGAIGELTMDTDTKQLRLHDGATLGGVKIPSDATADYVVEFQAPTAGNNYTWYRKYKSGWVEQGGLDGGSTQGGTSDRRVNIPITMSDANYYINCQKTSQWDGAGLSIQVGARDTTGFSWSITYSNSAQDRNICWEVKGMAA